MTHIVKSISSSINIDSNIQKIWNNITNVEIEKFSDPVCFRVLGIPKPLNAEVINEEKGGERIAYFNTGKRFVQEITTWNPYTEYSFNFNPEKGFIVGHFFDLSDGIFRIISGKYFLINNSNSVALSLSTSYSLDRKIYLLFDIPVRLVLKSFQKYLLKSIKKNSEERE